ncbi:MAG: hypothetical protein NVS1B4_10440 [Gemmatimonadaceae bacterium]
MFAGCPPALRAQQADVIRGQVVAPEGTPVEGARVAATSIPGNVRRQAVTGADGRFAFTIPDGDGDYLITVAALGYGAKRFEVKRVADEEILIADVTLARVAMRLDEVAVTSDRLKVPRGTEVPDLGGTERIVNADAVAAFDLGDLASLAATLPGVLFVPGEDGSANGFSVFGLGASQNNTTLNGVSVGAGRLPRDAAVAASLATSPYDVSRGGFAGGQFVLRTRPGSNFSVRGMSVSMDAPQLQWTDRAARALGQQYGEASVGGLVLGALAPDRVFYNVAYQIGRRVSDFQSLLNTSAPGLKVAGVSADSAGSLIGILGRAGVPLTSRRVPRQATLDQGSVFGSIDIAAPTSSTGRSLGLAFNGGWSRRNPVLASATGLPSVGGERTAWNGGLQVRETGYVGNLLSESAVAASGSTTESEPYLMAPSGRVRNASLFADGSSGVQTLSFYGGANAATHGSTTTLSALNQLSWFSTDNRHRMKLTTEVRRDSYAQDQTTNALGTWVFNSLGELSAGQPVSFTRQLAPRRSGGAQLVAAMSLGDAFRPSTDLQLQYGVRLDGHRFLDTPVYNPELAGILGVRNDRVPTRLYVSPRVGFSWVYGTAASIPPSEGAARVPRAVIRGGFGVFQSVPAVQTFASAIDHTGLATGVQQISCVGAATPLPLWRAYDNDPSAIPERCADGSARTPFASNAPEVTLFAPDWSAPRSARANVSWTGPVLDNRFVATIGAIYSRNVSQGDLVDLNFDPTVRFTLSDEGGRPVFVDPSSIAPASGAIGSATARISSRWSHVIEQRSDLESRSGQLSLNIEPARQSANVAWSVGYVYSDVRERARGFTAGTAANPLDLEWARSVYDTRHHLVYNVSFDAWNVGRVSWFGQLRSGTPFTPLIATDVNGDGWGNDRAFVFDPAAADPVMAGAMTALLRDGAAEARACLQHQLGRIAARTSCETPWTSSALMALTLNPATVRMPPRTSISLQLANPLGAADLLLHGEKGLRGWGQHATPDQTLLYVRGFDAAAKRYQYDVNPRFGSTDPARSAFRLPVTLTAMVRIDMGPTRERQILTQQLDRGRRSAGDRMPEGLVKIAVKAGLVNPMAMLLREQAALRLSGAQADSIATWSRLYSVRSDSIWSPVARYLAALPDDYDESDAYARYLAARRATVDLLMALAPAVKGLLSAEQSRRLPASVTGLLDPTYLASIRSGTTMYGTRGAMLSQGSAPTGAAIPLVGTMSKERRP